MFGYMTVYFIDRILKEWTYLTFMPWEKERGDELLYELVWHAIPHTVIR